MIESYDFGKIRIDGKIYNHDLIIYPSSLNKGDGVFPDKVKDWWRKESHQVYLDDVKEILEKQPKKIIFGTGYSGMMNVPEETRKILEKSGIEVIIEPTKKACEIYNKLFNQGGIVAALHLTC